MYFFPTRDTWWRHQRALYKFVEKCDRRTDGKTGRADSIGSIVCPIGRFQKRQNVLNIFLLSIPNRSNDLYPEIKSRVRINQTTTHSSNQPINHSLSPVSLNSFCVIPLYLPHSSLFLSQATNLPVQPFISYFECPILSLTLYLDVCQSACLFCLSVSLSICLSVNL